MAELDQENNADFEMHKREFTEFLDQEDGEGEYIQKIRDMISENSNRLVVDINDMRRWDAEIARQFIRRPSEYIRPFEAALEQTVSHIDPSFGKTTNNTQFHLGFKGSFGQNQVSPRQLLSKFLSQMVSMEGIVTKMSLVRPKVVKSVHYCKETNQHLSREYRDATSTDGLPTGSAYPTKDDNGNPLETEYGLCTFKDHQTVTIQEMPERAPHGQLPRSVDVIVDHDLVDRCKPGDRVRVVGIYRPLAGVAQSKQRDSIFRCVIISNNISTLGKEIQGLTIHPEDIENVRAISKRDDVADLLARSLAPSIFGHQFIKKALLLQLLGGVEKTLANGTHLRGDINIMMVGDPSTAKSQMLRFVLGTAPLAVNTTGRGSSGVGLTAAVTQDSDTGERRLEAGAMVMADRGIVCIDEFDKMSEGDRVAIHEVMEQQTVTIAKAGIHASLNARCSVLAAANPVYGKYAKDKRPQENIGLPDSLLSRFDLLFVVLDNLKPETDKMISDHVLRAHRYQRPGQEGIPLRLDHAALAGSADLEEDEATEEAASAVWEKFNPLLHLAVADGSRSEQILSIEFVKKYIHYAKNRFKPTLTDEATEIISDNYASLRQKQSHNTLPVTARTLETLIRLASAHAKLRLSQTVEAHDAEMAVGMMNFALYHDTSLEDKPAEEEEEQQAGDDDGDDGDDMDVDRNNKRAGEDSDDMDQSDEKRRRMSEGEEGGDDVADDQEAVLVDKQSPRYEACKQAVAGLFQQREYRGTEAPITALIDNLNQGEAQGGPYFRREVEAMLTELVQENRIMFMKEQGQIYQI